MKFGPLRERAVIPAQRHVQPATMFTLLFVVVLGLLATTSAHAECKGTCVAAWGNCMESHYCCGDASCIKKNNFWAGCVPKGSNPGADWDGADLSCGSAEAPPSGCSGDCLPHYERCETNPNCCEGSKCLKTTGGRAKCWPDWRRPLFDSWEGTELTCDGNPPGSQCEGTCLPAYSFCQDNPNCCEGSKCIKTVNGNAKCWPDDRRPLFTSWDGSVLTCEGSPPASNCEGQCLPHYERCETNPNCCAGSKCLKTTGGRAKCWPNWRRPLFASWDGTELTCDGSQTPPSTNEETVVKYSGKWANNPNGCSEEGACCQTYDDDTDFFRYNTLLTQSGDGEKCIISSDPPVYTVKPPRKPCGYGFRKPCPAGGKTVIYLREFACQGYNGREDCTEFCRDCTKQRDDQVEAFLSSWIEVNVKADGCIGELPDAFDLFRIVIDKNPNTVQRTTDRHRHVIGPDQFFEGVNPNVCVPCGWPELVPCESEPTCAPGLPIEDGRCKWE